MPYYLKNPPNKDGTCLIYLQFNYNGRKLKLYTGLKILPADWDPDKELPKRSFRLYSQFKAKLDKYDRIANETFHDLTLNFIPTPRQFAEEVKARYYPKAMTLSQFAYELAETKKLMTKQAYQNLARNLEEFNPDLKFDEVDSDVMHSFKEFLYKQDYAQNTAAKMFQRFRSVMFAAIDKGLTVNLRFRSKRVSVESVETTKIFLDELELGTMYNAELPDKLVKARDVFLVAAYTGVRYSDIWKIDKTSFHNRYFRITARKESRQVDIPVHPIVLEIMEKYGWELPRLSNAKLNVYIKDVGQLAKIDKSINVTTYPGGVRQDQKLPKYEMITVHTARRSLICNLIIAGVQREVIMAISGHRTDAAFKKYIRLTPQSLLDIAYKSEFFKGKLKIV